MAPADLDELEFEIRRLPDVVACAFEPDRVTVLVTPDAEPAHVEATVKAAMGRTVMAVRVVGGLGSPVPLAPGAGRHRPTKVAAVAGVAALAIASSVAAFTGNVGLPGGFPGGWVGGDDNPRPEVATSPLPEGPKAPGEVVTDYVARVPELVAPLSVIPTAPGGQGAAVTPPAIPSPVLALPAAPPLEVSLPAGPALPEVVGFVATAPAPVDLPVPQPEPPPPPPPEPPAVDGGNGGGGDGGGGKGNDSAKGNDGGNGHGKPDARAEGNGEPDARAEGNGEPDARAEGNDEPDPRDEGNDEPDPGDQGNDEPNGDHCDDILPERSSR